MPCINNKLNALQKRQPETVLRVTQFIPSALINMHATCGLRLLSLFENFLFLT